jgi:hypothetical protein
VVGRRQLGRGVAAMVSAKALAFSATSIAPADGSFAATAEEKLLGVTLP